jgi:hypothetical protein
VLRKEILLIWNFVGVILIGIMFLVSQGAVLAQGIPIAERMINIKGNWDKCEAKTQIDPDELMVDRGTTVTWINESQSEVKIKFGKGTNCEEVNPKAMGWRLNRNVDPNKCFVTRESIRSGGGTMSILFSETVQYGYEVEYVGKDRREAGTIKIRTGPGGRFHWG